VPFVLLCFVVIKARVIRTTVAVLAIGVCLLLMQAAARIGFSRLLERYAVAVNSLPAADQAVALTSSDPEAHRTRATILNRLQRTAEAEASLTTATNLRPNDDLLWLELASTREDLGNDEGALAAYDQAVRCAPYYAHTHWQRGNLLLRMRRYDGAFADLRQAAASNRKYLPTLIDLTWSLTAGDTKKTEALLQINNDDERLAFARFLAQKGKGKEVLEQVGLLKTPLSDQNRVELAHLLFVAKSFHESFELSGELTKPDEIGNSGFEESLLVDNSTRGWIVFRPPKAKLAIDVSDKFAGARSLQISLDGEWEPSEPLLSQVIVLSSPQRYRLTFALKTKDLVTGGPPRIVVEDAQTRRVLAKSEAFPQSTGVWQQMSVEFKMLAPADGVIIRLLRDSCSSAPCPIFGVIWLDEFSLQKL
jgi:tetratricopeptide (TPR) repeat protein